MSNDIHEDTVPTGCPDPAEGCYNCGAPVDDHMNSRTKYSGPVTQIFAQCEICGGPDITPIGECPRCGGMVFEFEDRFACFNEALGLCDFSLSKEYLIEIDFDGWERVEIANMLCGHPSTCRVCDASGTVIRRYAQELLYSESCGWHIKYTDLM